MKKELQRLIKLAERQGWEIRGGNDKHWKLIPPDKSKPIVVLPNSPSGSRTSLRKWERLLIKSGLRL